MSAHHKTDATIVRDRIQDLIRRGLNLDAVKAARPTLDYDGRYGDPDRFVEAIMELAPWVAEGRIKYAVEVVDGLEHAPDALNRLFTGDHAGKLIVKVSEPTP